MKGTIKHVPRPVKDNHLDIVYGREVANHQKMLPLDGSSISRLVGTQYSQAGFAIVAASHIAVRKREENESASKELYAAIRNSEFCFVPAFGRYVEKDRFGRLVNSLEDTAAIVFSQDRNGHPIPFERLREFALELGKKHYQDVVLIKAPNENPKFVVTRDLFDHVVGDTYEELGGEWRLEDLTQEFFRKMVSREIKQYRFTFAEQFINPTFTTVNEGHIRYLNGEIFLRPKAAEGLETRV